MPRLPRSPPRSRPPRLVPERPLPPYAYLPGVTPHPTRDPGGHRYGAETDLPQPPDPDRWRSCRDYLYGIDLFNCGYYWEAHEVWEGLWVACGRRGPTATFLKALINLAAAGFKARWRSAAGVRANAKTAARLFDAVAAQAGSRTGRTMGLDTGALAEYARTISTSPETPDPEAGAPALPAFDVSLRPE